MSELSRYYDALNEEREWQFTVAASFGMFGGLTLVMYSGAIWIVLAVAQFAGCAYFLYLATFGYAKKQRDLFSLFDSPNTENGSSIDAVVEAAGFVEKYDNRSHLLIFALIAVLMAIAVFSYRLAEIGG